MKPLPSSIALRSPRLLLSPLTDADAEALFEIQSDPSVMRYWNHAPWSDVGQARTAIAADLEARAAGQALSLGIRERESAQLIGTCLVFAWEAGSRRAELGYNLASRAQGKGFMHEALHRLLAYLFDELGLLRLEAEIDPRNAPSAKVLERLGFRHEGLLRQRWIVEGEVSDSALYGLLAGEFRAQQA